MESIYGFVLLLLAGLALAASGAQVEAAASFEQDIPDPGAVFVQTTSTRVDVCLNGRWSFLLSDERTPPAATAEWGRIPVPGTWNRGWPTAATARGGEALPLDALRRGLTPWYQRRVVMPAPLPAQPGSLRVVVDFRDISGVATVFADGREVGTVREWGQADISEEISRDGQCTLSIRVTATSSGEEEGRPLSERGIRGDVFLRVMPRQSAVGHVTVRTSVTQRNWEAIASLERLTAGEEYRLLVEALSHDGAVAARMEKSFSASGPEAEVVVSGAWEGARYWEPTDPYLYRWRARLYDGRGRLRDELVGTFGFREFGVAGAEFMLNGRSVRLRPITYDWGNLLCPVLIRAQLSGIKAEGFNIVQYWPSGFPPGLEHLAAEADRQGIMLIMPLESMIRLTDQFRQGRVDPEWLARVRRQVGLLGNHPSVVMWGTNPNFFGTVRPPFYVTGAPLQYPYQKASREGARAALAAYKSVDPTRPVIFHNSDVGDISAPNTYLNMMPLQEQRDYLDRWAAEKAYPLMMIESAAPWFESVMRHRRSVGGGYRSAPFATEAAAIYLGNEAYELEREEYLRRIEERFVGNEAYQSWHYPFPPTQEPNLNRVSALFIRERWRAWRTWGIPGGMVPWEYRNWAYDTSRSSPPEDETPIAIGPRSVPGMWPDSLPRGWLAPWTVSGSKDAPYARAWRPAGQALQQVNQALLVYIGGPAGAHTDQRHNFYSEGTLARDIIVVYDGDDPRGREVRLQWRVQAGGRTLVASQKSVIVHAAGDVRVPIRLRLPQVSERTEGRVTVLADGRETHTYSFTIFPRCQPPVLRRRVVAFDPAGLTSRMLGAFGVAVNPLAGRPAAGDLLVVGREALSRGGSLGFDLPAAVREGLKVVVFAQSADFWEERMGWRTAWHVARKFWTAQGAAAALSPLEDEDLADWAGTGTLLPARYEYPEEVVTSFPPPQPVWHCGNRGSVASVALEKPHFGSFTPLLEGEYDLAYSPLFELRYGKGVVYIVQLDLEDNVGRDPAADYLLAAVLKLANSLPTDRAARLLRWTGDAAAARAHLGQGGNVLVASSDPQTVRAAAKALGVEMSLGAARLRGGGTELPAWPELRGVSVSDLHWRGFLEVPVIAELRGGEIAANGLLAKTRVGKGMVVFCLATPSLFPIPEVRERRQRPDEQERPWKPEQKTYFRLSRWHTYRLLGQLSANLGGEPPEADRVFLERLAAPPEPAAVLDLTGPGWFARHDNGNGETEEWFRVELDESEWTPTEAPVPYRADAPWVQPGACWFRKRFALPAAMQGKPLAVRLSGVDTGEFVYLNGRELVQCVATRSSYAWERLYFVPAGLAAEENLLVVKTYPDSGNARLNTRPLQVETAGYSPFYHPDYDYEDNLYRWLPW